MKAGVITDPHDVQTGLKSDICGTPVWAGAQHSQSPMAATDGTMMAVTLFDGAAADCAVLLSKRRDNMGRMP